MGFCNSCGRPIVKADYGTNADGSLNDEYITLTEEPIDVDYINRLKAYANNILEVSNGIVTHDLIKNEEDKIGECDSEKK